MISKSFQVVLKVPFYGALIPESTTENSEQRVSSDFFAVVIRKNNGRFTGQSRFSYYA
jgi:hypothetical protein